MIVLKLLLYWFLCAFPIMTLAATARLKQGKLAKVLTVVCFPAVMWVRFWDMVFRIKNAGPGCDCVPGAPRDRGCGHCAYNTHRH